MAASKSYFSRPNCRFLPTDQSSVHDSMIFELDESEVWNSTASVTVSAGRSRSPQVRKVSSGRKAVTAAASVPVNVPDWSKILKEEYRENRSEGSDDYYGEEEEEEEGNRIPPHEFLARNRMASSSVQEGIGRTLKGRDLSRVRNAIWQKIGFQD